MKPSRLIVVFLAQSVLAAPDVPPRLTLREALSIALANSASLRRAAAHEAQAQAQAEAARSAQLPQLQVSAWEMVQTINLRAMGIETPFLPSRVGPFQVVDARAYLTQNVFNLPLQHYHRAARQQLRAASSLVSNARELLAFQVATAFAHALRAQNSLERLQLQVDLARQLLAITEERLRLGVASRLEANRARQQVNHLEQSLEESRHAAITAKLQLANLLAARITADYELLAEPPPPMMTPPDALARALQTRPDYLAATARLRAAELQLAAARHQRLPTLQFRAGYGQSGRKPFENLNTFHLQAVLSLPVYTGGRLEAEIAGARAHVAEMRAAADELRSQIEMEVAAAQAAVQSAQREYDIASQGVQLASEEVALASARYQSGVADNTEVVNAQDRLTRAEDNVVRATYRRDLALAQLRRALGVGARP